jgi:rSAM/selenodomain-associated transferase 2
LPVPVSVIIPVYRDADALARALAATQFSGAEVIVCATPDDDSIRSAKASADSARSAKVSSDPSRSAKASAERFPQDITWIDAPRGRARQMNAGAAVARGDWLVFLHADTRLPSGWTTAIDAASLNPRVNAGCFRFALDSRAPIARLLELGVRLRVALLGLPYGDQAIFVRRDAFMALRGYADLPIMEDVDLVRRLARRGRLYRSPLPAVTSARRWERDGWVRRTARHLLLIVLYFCGMPPARLVRLDPSRRPHPDAPGGRMSL